MAHFKTVIVYLVVCVCLLPVCHSQSLETYPVQNEGEDQVIVVATNDYDSISVYCQNSSNSIATTEWRINGTVLQFNSTTGLGSSPYEYLSVADDMSTHANLTYNLSIYDLDDTFELVCFSGIEEKTFLIGYPAPPVLITPQTPYVVIEGEDFTLDLYKSAPFPPYNNPVTSVWLLDGNTIDSALITVGEYNITIGSVSRNLTGLQFNLTASTNDGFDTQIFMLNVQYQPEAVTVRNNIREYRNIGDDVILIAADMISGNPSIQTTKWFDPMNDEIPSSVSGRFSFPAVGRLMITNITENDFGTYTFTATNGIGNDLIVKNMLSEHEPPGEPENVGVFEIEDELAILTWTPPSSLGSPPLQHYIIQLYPVNSQFETNSTMLELIGLIPGTKYNFTISATAGSSYMTSDSVAGNFTTLLGVPRIDSSTTISEDIGTIIISYSLKHTGGYNPETVSIGAVCGLTNSLSLPTMSKNSGSGDGNSYSFDDNYLECMFNCLDDNLGGTLEVNDLLTAGNSYICVVVAGNEEGDFYYNTTSLIATIGIPATPTFTVTLNQGSITITVLSQYPGVPITDNTYMFNVLVISTDGGEQVVYYNTSFNGTADRDILVSLPIGVYTIQIYSQNMYGISQEFSDATVNVTMAAPEPPTITDEFPFYAIIVTAVGGTVLIFIIFITIVVIALCIRRRHKKDSVSFYRSRYEMTIKRY